MTDPQEPFSAPERATPPATELDFAAVTEMLDVAPSTLRRWVQRFADYLDTATAARDSRFSARDVETLSIVRGLLAEGLSFEQAEARLRTLHGMGQDGGDVGEQAPSSGPAEPLALPSTTVRQAVQGILETQQAILNNQATIRELLGVVVQDNFNLKEENRRLRERMVELERSLAEYQRREETRKERLESRLRAVETTLGALQQQLAAWVQRQRDRRRHWFW